jgi:hypothetical protein
VSGQNYLQWRAAFDLTYNTTLAPNPNGLDGIYIDDVFWKPRVDADWRQNGTTQGQNTAQAQTDYRDGYKSYIADLRAVLPANAPQVWGNVADWGGGTLAGISPQYPQLLTGGVMEGMIGESYSYENTQAGDTGVAAWLRMMTDYKLVMQNTAAPQYQIFSCKIAATDYQTARYALGSCLLDNAYLYTYPTSYNAINNYDEYSFNLGAAIDPPYSSGVTAWLQGVYRRRFQNGIVLVNPKGNLAQTVALGANYIHLTGTQAPAINNGTTVTSVTLADRDGLILKFNPTGANVGAPHPFVTTFLAGSHYMSGAGHGPYDVYVSYALPTLPTLPCMLYLRWYERMDPNSNLTQSHNTPANLKCFSYANAADIPTNGCVVNVMLVTNPPGFTNSAVGYQMLMGQNAPPNVLENPDRNGHNPNQTGANELNPYNAANGWKLVEIEICIDQTTGAGGHGYFTRTVNGSLISNYAGATDNYTGTRYVSIGSGVYSGDYGDAGNTPASIANWSYLSDARIDMSGASVSGHCARVIFGNQPTLAASTVRSYMNISAWGPTSITGNFWKDKFTTGQTVYAHVVTESVGVLDNQFSAVVA